MSTNGFDYDVIVIGSGFGGSVAALRATEKGYKVGVLESGKRWPDEDIPSTSWDLRRFMWQPEAGMFGIQRLEFLDDVLVLCGAGVSGGSHVYGNTLYVPPKKFVTGTTLKWQCHGSQFDVTSGAVLQGLATRALTTYEVREENGEIKVRA
jgi:choline dehydrogenase-like flavoprotein